MAEALAMLGLVANIFQFVEIGLKILSNAKDIYESGQSTQARDIRLLLEDIKNTSDQTQNFKPGTLSTDELAIRTYSAECDAIAAELNLIVSKLVARDHAMSKKLESLRVAYQSVAKKNEMQRLAERLRELDARLRIRLQKVLDREAAEARNEQVSSIVAMIDSLDERARSLGTAIMANFDNERRVIKAELQSTGATILALVNRLAEDSRRAKTHQDLLQSLVFPDINQRYSDIDPAHHKTLTWMFDDSRTSFPGWLSSDAGIYWISGLAGSGKSTLMKYVYDESTTHRLLHQWAGSSKLVTAHVFFWNQGTRMQKSQQGLLQSLLFQILKADIDLALGLCRARYAMEPWSLQELRSTFAQIPEVSMSTTKFCFFIDGLDEYDGQEEDIIETIQQLASSPAIKICTSSRPWNRFREAFSSCSKLIVESLTKPDIERYIEAELTASKAFEESVEKDERCRSIISQVASRAQGVFLWVFLVVRSLRRDLQSREPFEHLQRRVDAMPPTLDQYFRRIFERIDPIYRRETARLFLLTLSLDTQNLEPLPLVACLYLEAENNNPDYAIELRTDEPPSPMRTEEWHQHRLKAARIAITRINDRCKDLLQARANGAYRKDSLHFSHISFLHRTVRDFLRDNYLAQLQEAGEDYSPVRSFSNILLALFKQYPLDLFFIPSPAFRPQAPKQLDPLYPSDLAPPKYVRPSEVLKKEQLKLALTQFWSFAQAHETEVSDATLNEFAKATSARYTPAWPSVLIQGACSERLALPDDLQMLAWAAYTDMIGYLERNWAAPNLARKFYEYGLPALSLALEPKRIAETRDPQTVALEGELRTPKLNVATVKILLSLQCKPNEADVGLNFLQQYHKAYFADPALSVPLATGGDGAKVLGTAEYASQALLAQKYCASKDDVFEVIKLLFEYGLRLPTVSLGVYRGQFQELFVPIFGETKVHDLWLIHQALQPRVGLMARMSRAFMGSR